MQIYNLLANLPSGLPIYFVEILHRNGKAVFAGCGSQGLCVFSSRCFQQKPVSVHSLHVLLYHCFELQQHLSFLHRVSFDVVP